MNKLIIRIIVIVILAVGIGAFLALQKPAFPQPLTLPATKEQLPTFLMIHFEVGEADFPWYKEIAPGADNRNLKYQEALWPTAVKLVDLANSYNFKLTLAFTPQWAEYILKDKRKIEIVKKWQEQGHEIAYHHHGIDHPDWDGYSNRPEAKSKEGYRGTAAEGFEFLKKLASPENVIVGTITDTAIDLPNDIKILTYGGGQYGSGHLADTVSEPESRIKGNKETIWLGHGFLESVFRNNKKTDDLLLELKEKYEKLPSNKVFGVVTHCHDFYRYPDALEEWFKYVNSKGDKIQTVKEIIGQTSEQPTKTAKSQEKISKDSPFGIHPATPSSEAKDINAKWTRTNSGLYLFWSFVDPGMTGDLSKFQWKGTAPNKQNKPSIFDYDSTFSKTREDGMEMMYNIDIEPRDGKKYHKQESWLPANEQAYRAFVKRAVMRYSFVKYWQIGNEPMERGLSDYGRFLLITYEAIKEGNPQAKVLAGGIAGLGMPQSFSEYKSNFDKNYLPLLEDVAKLNKRCFDIFDFHWFGNATGDYKTAKEVFGYITEKIKELKIPEPKEYWITEIGTYSGDPKQFKAKSDRIDWPYQTEKQQAVDLVKRYVYPLSFGVKKVFWAWGLKEGFKNNEGFFDFTGLIYDGKFDYDQGKDVKKLSYYTFKKMTEVLEGSDWNNIQTIQEKDGIYIYKFTKLGKPIWVVWNDNSQEKPVSISGITSQQVKITAAVPKYKLGKEVTDFNAAFKVETKTIPEGNLTITVSDMPVFVEEK